MALRFWLGTGADALWSNVNNWSATSGGAGGAAVPLATDDVTFDGAGNNACTVNTSNRVCKTLTMNGYTNTVTFTFNISVSGSITFTTTGFTFAGAGLLRMIAAGTWTTNGKTITQPVEIGGTTTFTCTLADALTGAAALTLTNTTSTIFAGAFVTTAPSCTVSGTQTLTLSGDVQVTNNTTISDATVINGSSFTWRTGGITVNGNLTGSVGVLEFNGTGTWSGSATLSLTTNINTAGTLTISGTVLVANNVSITYIAGSLVTTGSTISCAGTLGIGGFTASVPLNDVTITAAGGVNPSNSTAVIAGTLTLPNAAVTFGGGGGFTMGTLTNTTITATRIWTLTAGYTYRITGALTPVHAAAQTVRFTLTSSHGTNRAFVVLGPGATQDVGFMDPTRIDASGGQTIFSYHGTITDSPGWSSDLPLLPGLVQPDFQLGM